jgi:uncharacterized membrane protein
LKQKKRNSNLPQRNNQEPNGSQILAAKREIYSGPLPAPNTLKQFDEIVPGSAERIISQFEKQSEHRRLQEDRIIRHDIIKSYVGLGLGFIIGIVLIVGGLYLTTLGLTVEGAIIGGTALVSLVSVFIYGSQARRKNLQQKRDD